MEIFMRKKIKEVEKSYKFINKIIDSANSHLIKKLLLDNIIIITTKHDLSPSNLFYNYLKRGVIDYKSKNVLKYKQNQNNPNKKYAKIIRLFQFGIKFILKPKKIWNITNIIDKKIILIYVPPGLRYLDLALPIYEKIKNISEFTPLLLYHWGEGKFCENNYKQINLFDYSIRVNQLCKILKDLIMTKKAINKEKKYKDFYNAIFKVIWKTQLINLIDEDIFRNLIKNTNKIKAIFFCSDPFTRVLSVIAKEFDIPTFSIIGMLISYDLEFKFINTKFILAKGKQEKEIYINLGFDEKKLKVVGTPDLEFKFINTKFILAKGKQEKEIYINLGFDEKKLKVVGTPFLKEKIINKGTMCGQIKIFYVDQPFTQSFGIYCKRKIITLIGNKLKNLNNIKLLIKLHPASIDHEKIYEEEFHTIGFSNYQIYKSKYDLNKVLDISDYAIIHNSTVGFNVLFMNKPLIVLSNSFFEEDTGIDAELLFFSERIAFTIRNEQDLQDIFTRISEGKLKRKNYKDIKTFLKYYIKYTGETAAEHIVKFIESKIRESEIKGT